MGSRVRQWLGWVGAALLLGAPLANGQTLAKKGWVGSGITVESWWDGAVFYQIDPVSFQDSDGDGFGDLKGIIQRLDYLQGLGVDALVLSPFQLEAALGKTGAGPTFDPQLGSMEDLDQLMLELSRRRMRILVDLPLSTSRSTQETVNAARFWLSRGVAGLRLIADAGDMHERRAAGPFAHEPWLSGAQIADRIRQLQRLCATFAGQRVLLSDLPDLTPASAPVVHSSYGRRGAAPATAGRGDGAQMVVDSRLALMPHFDAGDLRHALDPAAAKVGGVPVAESDAADQTRSVDRYGDGVHDVELAKLVGTALLLGRGSPLVYFGQEIGMATDAEQQGPTPMQWGRKAGATAETGSELDGFSSGAPWMDMGPNAAMANVALEDVDAESVLNWYRKLSALRHANPALRNGTMEVIAQGNPDIVAWIRSVPAAVSTTVPVVVVCNVTNRPLLVSVRADVQKLGIETGVGMMHTLTSTALSASTAALGTSGKEPVTGPVSMSGISLPPYGIYIGELPRQAGLESAPSPIRSRYKPRTSP